MLEPAIFLVLVGCAAALVLVHPVRSHERLAVLRRGAPVGVRGPGLVVVLPPHRTRRLSLVPWHLGPTVVRATTLDRHEVTLTARCRLRIGEPDVAADFVDLRGLAAAAVDRALVAHVAERCLDDLVGTERIDVDTSSWGVVVDEMTVERADVRLTAQVLPPGAR